MQYRPKYSGRLLLSLLAAALFVTVAPAQQSASPTVPASAKKSNIVVIWCDHIGMWGCVTVKHDRP
jgi:hypothetical protein